jgi:thioredoxin 1
MSGKNVIDLNTGNFEEQVLKSKIPVLVDFWAPWCGPCKMIAPILEDVAGELGDTARICKINVDEQGELSSKFKILSIPTLILFKNGEVFDKLVGARSKDELKEFVKKAM